MWEQVREDVEVGGVVCAELLDGAGKVDGCRLAEVEGALDAGV